jgi:hypothetical protein
VQEESPGAAPDELMVHYCDMFPFRKDALATSTWIPRQDVPGYIRSELVPAMVEAFRVQSDEWGLPWHQAWTGYHPEEQEERLSVALSEGQTWFHGPAPSRGHSGISINLNAASNANYDTLTDGLMSNFHHELFHNHQLNISQSSGGIGIIDGTKDAWQFFSEGMAVLVSSVGQPDVQFSQTVETRDYMSDANNFVGGGGLLGELTMNRSYEIMSPYRAAAYWRFLYEQCGGMTNGVQDPAAGMRIIRRTLTELYSKETVDISSSTDLVKKMPEIMDRVLASPEASSCPFRTYEDSLIHFARALYALRLEGGRCTGPGTPVGCGFYDPEHLYRDPSVGTITYRGTPVTYAEGDQAYPAGIRNSYGMDFVDVLLDASADGQSLAFEFYSAPGADAAFNVQVWELMDPGGGSRPQPVSTEVAGPKILTTTNPGGKLLYLIPAIDTTEYNRLGFIITRIDADESSDPVGAYTIVLRPFTLPTQPAVPPR